jgi:hypothetical protein
MIIAAKKYMHLLMMILIRSAKASVEFLSFQAISKALQISLDKTISKSSSLLQTCQSNKKAD